MKPYSKRGVSMSDNTLDPKDQPIISAKEVNSSIENRELEVKAEDNSPAGNFKKDESPVKERKNTEVKNDKPIQKSSKSTPKAKKKNEKLEQPVATLNPGDQLEYRVKRLFFYMGYLPKKGIIIKTSQDDQAETITDLDVYGIYFHKDFRYKTIWADCKSGNARPLERISWIKGVREIYNVDDVLFIKGNVKSTVKHFARKSDIQVLDTALLEKLEQDFHIQKDDWSGSWNPNVIDKKLYNFSHLSIPTNEPFKKIANFISNEFWAIDNYTQLKKCITAFRELSKVPIEILNPSDATTIKWAIYELTTLFTLSILSICKELYYFSDSEREVALRDGILSSDMSIKKRTEIVTASYKLAFELVRTQVPDFIPPTDLGNYIRITPPSYYDGLVDLIKRVSHNPIDYYDILRPLDYILFENDLLSKEYEWGKLDKTFSNIDNNIRGFKTILHFICQTTGISTKLYPLLKNLNR